MANEHVFVKPDEKDWEKTFPCFEKIGEDKVLITTPRLKAVGVEYFQPDTGKTLKHTIIRSKPSVATVCRLRDEQSTCMIAFGVEFRTSTGRWYMKLPAGLIEEGESRREAAIREAHEEMGLVLGEVCELAHCPIILDPSKGDEDFGLVQAEIKGFAQQHLDAGEAIQKQIFLLPEKEVRSRLLQMLDGHHFWAGLDLDGHSLTALQTYFLRQCFER